MLTYHQDLFSPLTPMPMPGSCHCSGRSTQQTCTRHPPRAQWSQCHSSRKKLSWVCFSDLNVFWDFLRYYLPAFSFCRDTWPCHCCPWPPWRRPGKAQTGTFDVPATDVSTSSGPTHGKYPKNWKCDNKLFFSDTSTWRMTSPRRSLVRSQPSRRERWRASLAFLGTERHTSKPSLISPT